MKLEILILIMWFFFSAMASKIGSIVYRNQNELEKAKVANVNVIQSLLSIGILIYLFFQTR